MSNVMDIVETLPVAAPTASSTTPPLSPSSSGGDTDEAAWKTSPEEAFRLHMKTWTGPRMKSENLERKRFLLLTAALKDANSQVAIDRLRKATKANELQIADGARDRSQLKSMSDLLHKCNGNARAVFAEMDASTERLRETMLREGRLIKLDNGSLVRNPASGERVLTREALERLKADKPALNVIVRRTEDKFIDDLRHQALTATAAVESGFQAADELNDGVNAQSSALVVARFDDVVSASTYAINQYRRNLDVITRRDADHSVGVRVDLAAYYADMRRRGIPVPRDLREFSRFNARAVNTELGMIADRMREVLVLRECMDDVVFTSRLVALIADQSLPRVIEWSRAYELCFAALRVLQQTSSLPSQASIDADETAFHKRFIKAVGTAHAITRVSDGPTRHVRSEPWRQMLTSKEMISEVTSRMVIAARDALFAEARQLANWYSLESRFHSGAMAAAEIDTLQYAPFYARDTYTQFPDIVAYRYYQELWAANRKFCIALLHGYEAPILLFLQEYLPKEDAEVWRTRDLTPTGVDICPPVTLDAVRRNNERLCEWRAFEVDVRARALIADTLPTPPLRADLLDLHVQKTQPWSPTFRQMQQFHSCMNVLFRLPAEEIETLFERRNADIRRARAATEQEIEKARAGMERISLSTTVTPQATVGGATTATAKKN